MLVSTRWTTRRTGPDRGGSAGHARRSPARPAGHPRPDRRPGGSGARSRRGGRRASRTRSTNAAWSPRCAASTRSRSIRHPRLAPIGGVVQPYRCILTPRVVGNSRRAVRWRTVERGSGEAREPPGEAPARLSGFGVGERRASAQGAAAGDDPPVGPAAERGAGSTRAREIAGIGEPAVDDRHRVRAGPSTSAE